MIITRCFNCNKSFECQDFRVNELHMGKRKTLFCCKKCEGEYRKNQSPKNCICEVCGKLFHRKQSHINRNEHQYCSIKCKNIDNKVKMLGEGNHQFGLKGELNSSWKSNERISHYGYMLVRCLNHPFKNCDDFVFEHRLIAEKYLLTPICTVFINGIPYLSPEFDVHHIDFNRLNNDVNNLQVITRSDHMKLHQSLKYKNK